MLRGLGDSSAKAIQHAELPACYRQALLDGQGSLERGCLTTMMLALNKGSHYGGIEEVRRGMVEWQQWDDGDGGLGEEQ